MRVRDATPADFPAILALNEHWVRLLSPLSRERLEQLHAIHTYHRVAEIDGVVVGFLLAFREHVEYDSPNYAWFSERFNSFVYVDRVVVAQDAQGRGVGRALYDDMFAFAREIGAPIVAAEFYTIPPNPTSQRFHESYGFREVGAQDVYGTKRVSLQIATIQPRTESAPTSR